jgi:uncharacterized glyoxalase superfamily protein PhnB
MSASAKTYPSYAKVISGVVPYLTVQGAAKAAHFYEKVFGAEIAAFHPVDDKGRTMHIHLYINGGSVMLSDAYPEHGHAFVAPAGFNVNLGVDNIDKWFKRATDAGATVVMPVEEMFWGDRFGMVRDPFGVLWSMNEAKKQ